MVGIANGRANGTAVWHPDEPGLSPKDSDWALHEPVHEVDKRDVGTPDSWVPRHPSLIRLTGRHPFNVEPPPKILMEKGFITPVSLHYVRNHGPVPRLEWDTHTVTINGLGIAQPLVLTMDQIAAMPSVTFPCTLVCAGNRRKEQNMVKKSIGFNWGPAATACSHWTGVLMSDLLRAAGVQWPTRQHLHVCYRGPVGELPQGEDGSYGSSLPLSKVMDPAADILVAYLQNGRRLTPDHGYPVRMVAPGHIGGRTVKWLTEITISDAESDNFYHYHDNRVLPSHVNEALAKKEGWWFKPDYVINELNINSACTSPAHDEVLSLASASTYTVRGYAYSGGSKIIRCEVSLDDGRSWRLADIQRYGEPNLYGRHWCWVHWSLALNTVELLQAKEIICRAWDAHMNTQPNSFTWNLMGMMNNCVYRVKIHPVTTTAGGYALQFEHPILAGSLVGGWMNSGDKPEAQPVEAPPPVVSTTGRRLTMEEVAKHDNAQSCWFVRNGKVYDATPFLKEHPGGAESILLVAGQDATEEFDAIHSDKAKKMVEQYCIGELASASEPNGAVPNGVHTTAPVEPELIALDPKKRQKFKLIEKHNLSHNVRRFRFALQSPKHTFGLPVGKHVFLYAKVNGELVMRAYTPTSCNDDLGYFDLVIKVYWANEHPKFPAGGKMSQALEALAVGDEMEVKGPLGEFVYLGRGRYEHEKVEHSATHISMIAGGTGITPCYQVLKAVLKDADDTTQLALLFANQSPDDILLREELDELAAAHPNFKVWYTVDRAPEEGWAFSQGFISEDMIRQHLFPASPSTICVMCGPPPMLKFACLPNLASLGYQDEHCILF